MKLGETACFHSLLGSPKHLHKLLDPLHYPNWLHRLCLSIKKHVAPATVVFAGMMASVLLCDRIVPVMMRKSPQLHPAMKTKKMS